MGEEGVPEHEAAERVGAGRNKPDVQVLVSSGQHIVRDFVRDWTSIAEEEALHFERWEAHLRRVCGGATASNTIVEVLRSSDVFCGFGEPCDEAGGDCRIAAVSRVASSFVIGAKGRCGLKNEP